MDRSLLARKKTDRALGFRNAVGELRNGAADFLRTRRGPFCSNSFLPSSKPMIRIVDDPNSRRAYEQLVALQTEINDTDANYKCLPG